MAFRKRNSIKEKFNLGLPFLYTPEEKKTEEFRETSEPIFEQHIDENIIEHNKPNKEPDYIEQYGDKIAKSYPTPAFYAKGNVLALCIYRIINDRTRPFLQFLLVCEDGNGKSFKMPTIKHVYNNMKELINRTSEEVQQFFTGLETETEYKGFILNEKAAIVFAAHDYMLTVDKYDTDFSAQTKNNTKMKTKTKEKKWCWVLPTEIVNDGSCMNIPIDEADTDFFCKNKAMINLYTESEAQTHTEAPMVAYSIATESILEYQCIFGAPRASSSYYYGPYYLFGSYNQTILEMAQIKKQDNKLIMVRSLFFPGKVKVSVDTERDHTERDHTDTENKAEQDIEWTDRYDSVFFVDSATKHVKYICKSRNQQQTLSYIYIT